MATGSSGEAKIASSEEDQRAEQSLRTPRESSAGEDANGSETSSQHNQGNTSGVSSLNVSPLVIDDPGMIQIVTSKILNQPIRPPYPRSILDLGGGGESVFYQTPEVLTMFPGAGCDLSNAWYFFQKGPTNWIRHDVPSGYWRKYSCTRHVMKGRKDMGSKKTHKFFRVIDGDEQNTFWFVDEFRVNIDSPVFKKKIPCEHQYILCKLYRELPRDTPTSSSEHEPPSDSSASGEDENSDTSSKVKRRLRF